jgi:hypothetical protein
MAMSVGIDCPSTVSVPASLASRQDSGGLRTGNFGHRYQGSISAHDNAALRKLRSEPFRPACAQRNRRRGLLRFSGMPKLFVLTVHRYMVRVATPEFGLIILYRHRLKIVVMLNRPIGNRRRVRACLSGQRTAFRASPAWRRSCQS